VLRCPSVALAMRRRIGWPADWSTTPRISWHSTNVGDLQHPYRHRVHPDRRHAGSSVAGPEGAL